VGLIKNVVIGGAEQFLVGPKPEVRKGKNLKNGEAPGAGNRKNKQKRTNARSDLEGPSSGGEEVSALLKVQARVWETASAIGNKRFHCGLSYRETGGSEA